MKTQKEVQDKILKLLYAYGENVGEDPLEYQEESMPHVTEFVQWCKDKGYIKFYNYELYMTKPFEYELFQVVNEEECDGFFMNDEDGYKALAEFISLSESRTKHFYNTFNNGSRKEI